MVVGLGDGEFFVASDIPAILSHTREMVFMEDGEVAVFHRGSVAFSTTGGAPLDKKARHIDWSPLMAEKGGYRHFMLKEIYEQPRAIRDTIAGRLNEEEGDVFLEDLKLADGELAGHRPGHHHRLRHLLACRARGEIPHRGALPRFPWRWTSPPSSATATRSSTTGP